MAAGLATAGQYVRAIIFDLFWKFMWLVCVVVGFWLVVTLCISMIGSTPYEGPDLGQVNPMVWIGIAAQLWQTYASMVAAIIGLFALGCALLWIVLEALFRGGRSAFWIYFVSGTARAAALAGVAGLLGALLIQDRSAGTVFIALIIFTGLWFLVITAETLVRRDAVHLIGTDLGALMAASACFFTIELGAGILLWGTVFAATLLSSTGTQFLFAAVIAALVSLIWTAFHSLLVAVRFSTIDFMRSNPRDE